MPKTYTWLDQKYVMLPDVTGLSLEEAKKVLKDFKITYSGSGDKVTYQSPLAGTYIKEKGNVAIHLS